MVSVVTEHHTIILLFFALADMFQSSSFCTISLPVPYILYILGIPRHHISCASVINGVRQDLK